MKNKLVVYTAAFGKDVAIVPQKKISGVDFICFTETEKKISGWQYRIVKPQYEDDHVRNNRYYKLLPHIHFPDYETSIYIDSNIIVVSLPEDYFESLLKGNNFLAFDHNNTIKDPRNCIYKEFEALVAMDRIGKGKDDLFIMQEQINFIRYSGYPENNNLIKGGVLIRKHLQPKVIETMNLWWDFVKNRSRRDQLSFNFVAWKTGLTIGYLPGDLRRGNDWFYYAGKGDKSLVYSLLKYRIRRLLRKKSATKK